MKKMPLLKTAMTPFPYSVDLDAAFDEASELMGCHNVRHLPVTHDHRVIGVITDKDMTSAMNLHSSSEIAGSLNVRDLYMADPYIVSVDEPLDNVLLAMAERHIGSAIVTKADKLVGMFTAVDACRSFGEYLREHFPHPEDDEVA
ncbi:MAG: CBS domain-containing protein [Pseudomonadota bacterium]|nr:CBS domain-containing protein [Pseudomonadota bacterium]